MRRNRHGRSGLRNALFPRAAGLIMIAAKRRPDHQMLRINDQISIEEWELVESFTRAQGPGGQNVNKVANAVLLRFDVRASSLPEACKAALLARRDRRLTADGVLVIRS